MLIVAQLSLIRSNEGGRKAILRPGEHSRAKRTSTKVPKYFPKRTASSPERENTCRWQVTAAVPDRFVFPILLVDVPRRIEAAAFDSLPPPSDSGMTLFFFPLPLVFYDRPRYVCFNFFSEFVQLPRPTDTSTIDAEAKAQLKSKDVRVARASARGVESRGRLKENAFAFRDISRGVARGLTDRSGRHRKRISR